MPCCAILLAFFSPRLALVAVWLLSDLLSRAFEGQLLLPLAGFFLLPWTTLLYAGMWSYGPAGVDGFEWFIVGFAFLVDIGVVGSAANRR